MKKMITLSLILFILILNFSACSSFNDDYVVDAKTYIDIHVPRDSQIFFQASWYRLSAVDYNSKKQLENKYVLGENVAVYGENVEQLYGSEIYLSQIDLSDLVNEEYYKTLLLAEDYTYELNKYNSVNNEFLVPADDEIDEVEKTLQPYIANLKVLLCNFVMSSSIDEFVNVEKIEIHDIEFEFAFDTFNITPLDIPSDQTGEVFDLADFSDFNGMFAGPVLSPVSSYFISGIAKESIKAVTVSSVDDDCIIIDQNNYMNYKDYEEEYDTILFEGRQKTENFEPGDQIRIDFSYIYKPIDLEELKTYDIFVSSIQSCYLLEDGTSIYSYDFQQNMRVAEYGLVHLLHQLLK